MAFSVRGGYNGRDVYKRQALQRALLQARALWAVACLPRDGRAPLDVYKRQDCVQVIGSKFVLYLPKKKDSQYAALLKG